MVTLDDVRAAAVRIRGVAVRTPLLEVGPLALKCENLQPMGAFKIRGAYNFLAQLPAQARTAGVITYSIVSATPVENPPHGPIAERAKE